MNEAFESLDSYLPVQCSRLPLYKPLRIELLDVDPSYRGLNTLECMQKADVDLPALLADMPRTEDDDLQQGIDLLLGPSIVESVRYIVEVGVYLSSNSLYTYQTDNLIAWMLRNVSWAVLRPILSAPVPAIRAFAEAVLKAATKVANIQVVSDLLESPRLKSLVRSSGELLVRAVQTSNAELVRLFLHAGARANKGWSHILPLEEAKTVEIARMLVEAGADVNGLVLHGEGPPLVRAARRHDIKLAQYLISAGADVNKAASSKDTALSWAASGHDFKLARYLINAGADVNPWSTGKTPLAIAASENQTELLQLLLQVDRGAHVNTVSRAVYPMGSSRTLLQFAAESGNLNSVKLLVEAGANVNAPACDIKGMTALQAASYGGHIDMVAFLLHSGANVDAPGNGDVHFPKTVLTTAVERNHLKLVKLLLNAGADVNLPSFGCYGCTALEAAKSGPASSDIVNLLIAKGARDTAPLLGPHRKIELYHAVRKGDCSRVKHLMRIGVQVDMQIIGGPSCKYGTILHCALEGFITSVNISLFRLLVNNIEDVNAQNKSPHVEPILIVAIKSGNKEVVEILCDAGADINVTSYKDGTPLMAAARCRNCELVRFLVSKGAAVNAIVESSTATTALQTSLERRSEDIFYFLLNQGATINAPIAPYGCSELTSAVRWNNIEIVRELLDRGAEIKALRGPPVVHAAVTGWPANMAMVQLLLERGADVNARSNGGLKESALQTLSNGGLKETALQTATRYGQFQLVLFLLLQAGADVNAQCYYNGTALTTAAQHGRLDILFLLLKAGADMHLPVEERFVKAARLARDEGHAVIAEILEGWDKSEDLQDDREDGTQYSKGKGRAVELS